MELSNYPVGYNLQHRGGTRAQIDTAIALAEALYAVQQRREALRAERDSARRDGAGPSLSGWFQFVCTWETQGARLERLDRELAQLDAWDRELRDAFAAAGLDANPFRAGGVGYAFESVEEGRGIDHWAKGLGPAHGRGSPHAIGRTGDEVVLVDLATLGASGLVRRGCKALLQKRLAATGAATAGLQAPKGGRWVGSRLSAEATQEAADSFVRRIASLKMGNMDAINEVRIVGSRATGWSKLKNRGPLADSDLDIAIDDWIGLKGSRHEARVVKRITAFAKEFEDATGIKVQLHVRSSYSRWEWGEYFGEYFK